MSLGDIYPEDLRVSALYPEITSDYLDNLERVDSHKLPSVLNGADIDTVVRQVIARIPEAVRSIEVNRRSLGYYASVLEALSTKFPDFLDTLDDESHATASAIIDRLTTDSHD